MTKCSFQGLFAPSCLLFCCLQTAGIDAFRHACHVQLLVPWGRKEEVVEHHGGLEGANLTQLPLLFCPMRKEETDRRFSPGMCFCWLDISLVWLHEGGYLIVLFLPRSWRDLLWQIHWIHLPGRGDLWAPQGLHDLGLYLHWSWTWENQLHHCQYVTESLFLELLFLTVIFSRPIYTIFPVSVSYSCVGFDPNLARTLKLQVLALCTYICTTKLLFCLR